MSADSLSVNDLSKALKKLGKRASPLDIATIQAEAHQIKQAEVQKVRQAEAQKVRQAEVRQERLSEGGEGDGLIDELVNDYSQVEAEPQNAAPQGNGNMYIIGCALYMVHCTLYILHCTWCIVHCTMCIVHCTLHSDTI